MGALGVRPGPVGVVEHMPIPLTVGGNLRLEFLVEFIAAEPLRGWKLYAFFTCHATAKDCAERWAQRGYQMRVRPVVYQDRAVSHA